MVGVRSSRLPLVQSFSWALALTISRGLHGGREVKQAATCAVVLVGTSVQPFVGNLLLTTGTIAFLSVL
jgi:hypothetical protein